MAQDQVQLQNLFCLASAVLVLLKLQVSLRGTSVLPFAGAASTRYCMFPLVS